MLQNGFAIREFRELKCWSGASLAAEIGISKGTLSNIEAERRSTSFEVLHGIARILELPIEAILREREQARTNGTVRSVTPSGAVA